MTIDEPSCTRVHNQLRIANIAYVQQESFDADRVITVCQEPVVENVNTAYGWYNLDDGKSDYGGECTYSLFSQAASSLTDALRRGEDVIIHCHRGRSRSASVAIAALCVYSDMSWDDMYARVEESRPCIDPDGMLRVFGRGFVREHRKEKVKVELPPGVC
jgi:hypothetical protein